MEESIPQILISLLSITDFLLQEEPLQKEREKESQDQW